MQKHLLLLLCAFIYGVNGQHLLLAGGNLKQNSTQYWKRLVQLAGGKESKIAVFTCGSENPQTEFEAISSYLQNFGANATLISVAVDQPELANNDDTADLVRLHNAVFFADGDVTKIVGALKNPDGSDTSVLAAIRTVFNERGVVGGSGAGAMVLTAAPVIVTGNSYESLILGAKVYSSVPAALPTPTTPAPAAKRTKRPTRKSKVKDQPQGDQPQADQPDADQSGLTYIESGLGFMKNWTIDTRFNDLSRQGRLIALLLDTKQLPTGTARGIGVDEEMGIAIYRVGREDEYAEILGNRGGVTIVDTTPATFKRQPLEIEGVTMTFFTEDDKLILDAGEIIPATWKTDVDGQEWHFLAETSQDIFSSPLNPDGVPGQFHNTAKRLYDSWLSKKVVSTTFETNPQLTIEMDRRNGYGFHNDSPTTAKHYLSFVNMSVAITQKQQ